MTKMKICFTSFAARIALWSIRQTVCTTIAWRTVGRAVALYKHHSNHHRISTKGDVFVTGKLELLCGILETILSAVLLGDNA